MKICAIVCEFNPFHNGHAYLIKKAKSLGFSHVVAIMSGYFTQRGEISVLSKKAKTQVSLLNGVDLVIDLPCLYSLSRAEIFARSSVYLANSLGCIDALVFGSESGDLETLNFASKISISEKLNNKIKEKLKNGKSFAKLRQNLISELYNEKIADVFSHSNNNLAIEYIKSLNYFNSKIKPMTILRNRDFQKFISSSQIRETLLQDSTLSSLESLSEFIPKGAFNILKREINEKRAPFNFKNLERAILFQLKKLSLSDIALAPDISEGLEFRIFKEIQNANSIDSLIKNIKSKRYTLARIRRIILSLALGITKQNQDILPNYIRVLGFNKNGEKILSKIKNEASLPIITKYSDVIKLNNYDVLNNFEFESLIAKFYSLALPEIQNIEEKKFSAINFEKLQNFEN